jgi:hypothetical protein
VSIRQRRWCPWWKILNDFCEQRNRDTEISPLARGLGSRLGLFANQGLSSIDERGQNRSPTVGIALFPPAVEADLISCRVDPRRSPPIVPLTGRRRVLPRSRAGTAQPLPRLRGSPLRFRRVSHQPLPARDARQHRASIRYETRSRHRIFRPRSAYAPSQRSHQRALRPSHLAKPRSAIVSSGH